MRLLLLCLSLTLLCLSQKVILDIAYSAEGRHCYDVWTVSYTYDDWSRVVSSLDTYPVESPYNGPFKIHVTNDLVFVPSRDNQAPYIYVNSGCEALIMLDASSGCQSLYWYPLTNVNCNNSLV